MSQITNSRKGRIIRRAVAVILIFVVAPASYLAYSLTRDRRPVVRTAAITTGDITSSITITAMLRPGSTQKALVGRQKAQEVLVRPGDQVKAGDLLITFDISEFETNLETARSAREQAEAAVEKLSAARTEQAEAAQKAITDLQRQLERLSSGLSGTTRTLSEMLTQNPLVLTVDEGLSQEVAALLAEINPQSADAAQQIDSIVNLLTTGIQIETSQEYKKQLNAMTNDINRMNGAFESLASNEQLLALALSGGSADSISSLGSSLQSALSAAIQAEIQAELALENAVEAVYADIDGVVVAVNAVSGEYTGTQGVSGGSLGSLFGGQVPTATGEPVVVIYDNTKPKAYFQANRFDASRLRVGMPVTFRQDEDVFFGRITYKSPVATNVGFETSTSGDFWSGSVSGVGGLTTEPLLDIEMSLTGDNIDHLVLGFNIEAEIETASAQDVLLLPAEALRKELGVYFVFVLTGDGRLERREITPGIQSDLYAEVLTGLTVGERVVLSPTNNLVDGIEVREAKHD
ncbi:MAG: hypothetical protein GX218_08975 [Clostridiaceae bacterium]|jgi:HlyD family secretion protein|nr:hypothetical protein [Clostridiaceae bacterium]